MNKKHLKWAVLISLLVLPVLIYISFVYSAEENFFKTLGYVGPREVVESMDEDGNPKADTAFYQIPDFAYKNQFGQTIIRDSLMGKVQVVSIFFASCPSICPAMNFHLKEVMGRFKGYENFGIVSFTVDPKRDTVEALRNYAKKLGVQEHNWHFLTGDRDSLYATAAGLFLNAMEDAQADGGYLHSESVLLVDWNGNIRSRHDDFGNLKGAYNVLETTELNELKDDIKILIAEHHKHIAREEHKEQKRLKKEAKQSKK